MTNDDKRAPRTTLQAQLFKEAGSYSSVKAKEILSTELPGSLEFRQHVLK
jgi:hypothetical protein